MAFAHIQGSGNATSTEVTTLSVTLTGVTAGHVLVVGVVGDIFTTGALAFTCSDASNTYTSAAVYSNSAIIGITLSFQIFYAVVTTGGSLTVTITANTAANIGMAVDEYSYPGNFTIDSSVNNLTATATTAFTLGTITVSRASELIYAVFATGGSTTDTFTAGSGFVLRANNGNNADQPYAAEDALNVSANTAVTMTCSNAEAYGGIAVSFSGLLVYPEEVPFPRLPATLLAL
jgi:hypothetical protein